MKRDEDILQGKVFKLCAMRGLKVLHIKPAMVRKDKWVTHTSPDGKGWPDLTIVGRGGMVLRELKAPRGRLSPEQRDWLMLLSAAGHDAGVWRPADLDSGLIVRTLQRLSKPRPLPTTTEPSPGGQPQ